MVLKMALLSRIVSADAEVGDRIDVARDQAAGELEYVRTATARQHVPAASAVQDVVASIADDPVVERVAGAVDVGAARQRQILDLLAVQAEAHKLRTRSVPPPLDSSHHVADVVDDIDVVSGAAVHRVGAARLRSGCYRQNYR